MKETAEKLDVIRGEAEKNFKALPHIMSAFPYLLSGGPEQWPKVRRDVEKVIHDIKPPDPKILGWAYAIHGYVMRRQVGAREALASIERSLELDPANGRTWYNAACYAALTGDVRWSDFLSQAIRLEPQLKHDTIIDVDFDSVKADPEFKRITGQG